MFRISVCRHDPSLKPHYALRELRSIQRRAVGADRKGQRKTPLKKAQRVTLDVPAQEEAVDEEPAKKKRKYISADQAIALQNSNA